ncbi:MAG: hypothetical protein WD512_05140 [Candidatus Paceibacterota bacterium]
MPATNKEPNPLLILYGLDVFDLACKEIRELQKNSNIPSDNEYIELAISFMKFKANDIIEGKIPHKTLKSLVSESFGEAGIYKYNIEGRD